jgi:perosamine synthetase
MIYKIPLSKPHLSKHDFLEIKKCFDSSWISSKSPWVEKFEKEFAKNISQTKYAVAVNSGTSALFLALKVLNIGPGDEVIIPTFTMIATINAVFWVGAKPVLVDCQSTEDWNISIEQIEKKITKRTKAIIPVHVYGYMIDMNKLNFLAKKYNLYLIEDAAEAMGSTFKEKNAGSFSNISCFSLYSNKIITTGNGGVLCTNDKNIYYLAKKISFFDFNEKIHFKHNLIGYNLVLSGLQAALGLSQTKNFKKMLKKRQLVFSWYKKFLKNNHNIKFIEPIKECKPNYWFPAIIFKNEKLKKKVIKALSQFKIETRDFFLPIHIQPVYKNEFEGEKYPNSEYFYKHGLLIPSFFAITKKEVGYICKIINKMT